MLFLVCSRMIYLTCLMMRSHYNLQPRCSVNSSELVEVMVIGERRNTIIKIVLMNIKYARFVVLPKLGKGVYSEPL